MSSANGIYPELRVDGSFIANRPDRRDSADPVVFKDNQSSGSQKIEAQFSGDFLDAEIDDSLIALNEILKSSDKRLSISVDSATGAAVFKIIDTTTGEVILQVPSKLTTGISKSLMTRRGVLLDSNQ
jgi:uncharacterized FlaG/YvyC family protein